MAFWNFCAAGNYAARFYKFAMTDVAALQQELQAKSLAAVAAADKKVKDIIAGSTFVTPGGTFFTGGYAVTALLTAYTNEQSLSITEAWRELLPHLITKYASHCAVRF